MKPKIIIGADHAGYKTKEFLKKRLQRRGFLIEDMGTFLKEKVDYPDYAQKVALAVVKDKTGQTKGILVCGTGIGVCIAANKIKGIRAAQIYDSYTATRARMHNDANVACLRGRKFSAVKAARFMEIFLNTEFSNEERHKRRIEKIERIKR